MAGVGGVKSRGLCPQEWAPAVMVRLGPDNLLPQADTARGPSPDAEQMPVLCS